MWRSAGSQLRLLSSQRHQLALYSRSKSRTHHLDGDISTLCLKHKPLKYAIIPCNDTIYGQGEKSGIRGSEELPYLKGQIVATIVESTSACYLELTTEYCPCSEVNDQVPTFNQWLW
jgi:hypothetical protein